MKTLFFTAVVAQYFFSVIQSEVFLTEALNKEISGLSARHHNVFLIFKKVRLLMGPIPPSSSGQQTCLCFVETC